jgi:hypothetical protein
LEVVFGIEEILGVGNCSEASDQAAASTLWLHRDGKRGSKLAIVPMRALLLLDIIATNGFNGSLSEIIVNSPANLISWS